MGKPGDVPVKVARFVPGWISNNPLVRPLGVKNIETMLLLGFFSVAVCSFFYFW